MCMVYAQGFTKICKNPEWCSRGFPSNGKEERHMSMPQAQKKEKDKVPQKRMHLRIKETKKKKKITLRG